MLCATYPASGVDWLMHDMIRSMPIFIVILLAAFVLVPNRTRAPKLSKRLEQKSQSLLS